MELTIRAGPSRHPESLKPCLVNVDSEPVFISSDHFEGFVTVRIQNHQPPPPSLVGQSAPTCAYFDNRSRVFSLQWQGRFNATNSLSKDGLWNADEILFVAEVENKIHVPMGTSIATAFARTIDPSFIADAIWDSTRPWVGSPLISGMNVLRVWRAPLDVTTTAQAKNAGEGQVVSREDDGICTESRAEEKVGQGEGREGERRVGPWIYYGANRLEEKNVDLLLDAGAMRRQEQQQVSGTTTMDIPSTDSLTNTTTSSPTTTNDQANSTVLQSLTPYQRRRFFTKVDHRQSAVFAPDLVIAGDFFNNFTNFETRRVRMGISIRMDRVLEEQPLRFVCKSRLKQGQQRRRRSIKIKRNRKSRNKHEVGATLSGGEDMEEEEEMNYTEEDEYLDGAKGGSEDGEEDDNRNNEEKMGDEIVFFVVELRWDQPGTVVL